MMGCCRLVWERVEGGSVDQWRGGGPKVCYIQHARNEMHCYVRSVSFTQLKVALFPFFFSFLGALGAPRRFLWFENFIASCENWRTDE